MLACGATRAEVRQARQNKEKEKKTLSVCAHRTPLARPQPLLPDEGGAEGAQLQAHARGGGAVVHQLGTWEKERGVTVREET